MTDRQDIRSASDSIGALPQADEIRAVMVWHLAINQDGDLTGVDEATAAILELLGAANGD